MRILHAYCLNYNLGDHALGLGVKGALRELLPVDFIAETNIQGQEFTRYYLDVIHRNFDALVIGGGGLIHGSHWPNGWFWLIDRELIREIRIPFIIYAVGYNYFENEADLPERGVIHLRETFARARLFSVRNDGSRDRLLSRTGLDAKVLGDPGFWVSRYFCGPRPAELPQPYLLIQLADDKSGYRFGSAETRGRFIEEMRKAVRELSQTHAVLMAPHVFGDVALCQAIVQTVPGAAVWDFSRFAFDDARSALSYYEHADAVVAMRGHGQILALAYGVPVVTLVNHPKHAGLLEDFKLGGQALPVSDSNLGRHVVAAVSQATASRQSLQATVAARLAAHWTNTANTLRGVDWRRQED